MRDIYIELETELQELNTKTQRLEKFLESESIEEIDNKHKNLLVVQKEAMKTYSSVLVSRMYLIVEEDLKR